MDRVSDAGAISVATAGARRLAESDGAHRSKPWEPWKLALLVTFLALASAVVRRVVIQSERGRIEIHGVFLGLAPGDVRTRFAPIGHGHWRSLEQADPVLEFLPDDGIARDDGGVQARFEFHGGILVAVRMIVPTSDQAAQGPSIDVSSASVIARRALTGGREELTLLARDCPTHAEEVHRLLDRR
jgi:hypothetical protein